MPRSVNKVILIGHLGKDAETRYTSGGVAVSSFSIATSRRWKDQASGDWKEETDWHNVVVWKSENLTQYLTKGKPVYVEGRLQTRSWEDKEGNKRYTTEIVSENLILLGGDKSNDQGEMVSAPRSSGRAIKPQPQQTVITDDDVPF